MENNETMYFNINALLDYSMKRIIEDIMIDLKKDEEYQNRLIQKKLLFEDYPFLNELKNIQPVNINENRLVGLKYYIENEQKLNELMLKEMYYRGLKDAILLLSRARLFDKDFDL